MEQCSKPSDRLHREKFQGSILVSLTETHVRTQSSLAAFLWFLHIRSGLTENQGPPYSPFGPPLNPEPPIFRRSRGYIPSFPTKHHRTCKSLWGNNSQAPNALHKQNNLQFLTLNTCPPAPLSSRHLRLRVVIMQGISMKEDGVEELLQAMCV